MNTELMEALNVLEKEKNIRKEVVLKAIEESLVQACKHHFGKSDNIVVNMDYNTGEYDQYGKGSSRECRRSADSDQSS